MAVSNMLGHICSLLKVRYHTGVLAADAWDLTYIGLSEQLFERLTTSAAEPFLKGLKELFTNFWGALYMLK